MSSENDRLVVTLFGHTHDLCCVDNCQTVEMRILMKDSKGEGGEMTLILVKQGEYSNEESPVSDHSHLERLAALDAFYNMYPGPWSHKNSNEESSIPNHGSLKGLDESEDPYNPHNGPWLYRRRK